MSTPPGDLLGRLLQRRLIFIQGALETPRADMAVAQLLHLDALDSTLEITVHLNCPSADLRAALAVYDVMQTVRAPVRTICLGVATGAAALVIAGGGPGRRAALPSARITLADARHDIGGTLGELDVQTRELLRLRQQVHELLAKHTRQSLERIQRDAEREVTFSAEEAQAYGLIDEILQPDRDQDPERPRR